MAPLVMNAATFIRHGWVVAAWRVARCLRAVLAQDRPFAALEWLERLKFTDHRLRDKSSGGGRSYRAEIKWVISGTIQMAASASAEILNSINAPSASHHRPLPRAAA